MDTRVSDESMWAAIRDALSREDAGGQWIGVADYAARRGADPWPQRMREAGRSEDVTGELSAIGREVASDLGPSPLRQQLVQWLGEDVAAAAPLLSVFTGHGTDVEHAVVHVGPEELDALAQWLASAWNQSVTITAATVIGGGFSRRMWRTRILVGGDERRLIVRVEQGGMFGTDTASEVAAMTALLDSGFAVPAIVAVEPTGDVVGEPFLIMEEVPGEVRLDDDGLDDIIRAVAALHRVPVSVIDQRGRSPEQVISDNIDGWLRLYREHSPIAIPLIEHGAAWLHENLRPTGPSVVVHGDAGPGNALFHPDHGLTMLDWEFAHVGDAAEDWVYLALIRGRRIMDAAAWRERLERVGGVALDEEQWRTWLAFNHFRGACVNLTARTVFESSPTPTADQLAIGVAVHLRFLAQLVEITCA
jgi:aminoglycoside phosphotransferase (APT) family kinase protein